MIQIRRRGRNTQITLRQVLRKHPKHAIFEYGIGLEMRDKVEKQLRMFDELCPDSAPRHCHPDVLWARAFGAAFARVAIVVEGGLCLTALCLSGHIGNVDVDVLIVTDGRCANVERRASIEAGSLQCCSNGRRDRRRAGVTIR